MTTQKTLNIGAKIISNGINISVNNKSYKIEFPQEIWQSIPNSVKEALAENITYANTQFLPLVLNKNKINYNTKLPLLESFLFRNEFFDLIDCEEYDHVKHLSYLKKFYDIDCAFKPGNSTEPLASEVSSFRSKKTVAILPFSFGKESLTTFCLCRELGITPILVYCQEPAHPYEEQYKRKKLKLFEKMFGVKTHFIKNEPGLFRYGLAFNKKLGTELGWGLQTTILTLLSIPFAYHYKAKYILYGNEHSNNMYENIKGWKRFCSYDQSSFWTQQQCNMVRILTNNQCEVKSVLEPLEEIDIFYTLHHRYPKIGLYQFSCHAKYPLYQDSQWCHKCSKCGRMFLYSATTNTTPFSLGFKKDLLNEKNQYAGYFSEKPGNDPDLDFCFHLLAKRKNKSKYVEKFKKERASKALPWNECYKFATELKDAKNLPDEFKDKLYTIFKEELKSFKKDVANVY